MKGELCLLLVVLATPCLSRPDTHQLGSALGPDERRSSGTDPGPVRRDLLEALSQDQKLLMAKFLPHIYAELANREGNWHEDAALRPLHDHDYPGWMDFGRRSLSESDETS
ncbi:gastrin/cholecystokinin-like peptide [Malaclemys terrapin pileata]|uniref:gastrin/cholecystokinin-like peptide n=1 Tax=Malaclemys terrapin pileata TaxID=2991368 RepID=UPI0023A7B185|nr:gastrin/cholecystokinin-like peptide [Malaclemys terrapin pileata]XP_053870478.1 gastrin/cholecystokinin-like peptide [Malaclemys terrapin pileata]XP_053870479.1 gastrin/cholecystokinin-like peptide [Malaclemys terrapin pileata]